MEFHTLLDENHAGADHAGGGGVTGQIAVELTDEFENELEDAIGGTLSAGGGGVTGQFITALEVVGGVEDGGGVTDSASAKLQKSIVHKIITYFFQNNILFELIK
ncbi:MAG: hypothetical protein ACOZBL_00180 [Patescibacteria group bacterium]